MTRRACKSDQCRVISNGRQRARFKPRSAARVLNQSNIRHELPGAICDHLAASLKGIPMTIPINDDFAAYLARIRKIQATRIWCDGEMAEIYRSARRQRLDVSKLKDAAKAIFAELKGRGDDFLQNSAAKERAQREAVPSPELLASWTAEDEALPAAFAPRPI
jgi:hypothetical protein